MVEQNNFKQKTPKIDGKTLGEVYLTQSADAPETPAISFASEGSQVPT
jgi:hypothetical protein